MLSSKEELIKYRSQSGVQRLNGHTKRGSETLGSQHSDVTLDWNWFRERQHFVASW